MTKPDEITHQSVVDTFRMAYSRRVGVGSARLSYADLEDKTDIPVRTLKSWREGDAAPNITNLLRLAAVPEFGPAFMSEVLGVIGQGGVEWIKPADKVHPMQTVAEMVHVTAAITERLKDGVFDTRDKAQTAPLLINLAQVIEEEAKAMLADVPK